MATRVSAILVDITALDVDAIVNAANEQLSPGGGVSGAIHEAGGPELAVACRRVSPCPTGEARLTPGFHLPARYVIHAVGPVWHGGGDDEARLLASAYRASINLAREHGLKTIAFPAISTGIYGYPLQEATRIAITSVREALKKAPAIKRVIFACFTPEVLEAYRAEGVEVQPDVVH
ncbi:MAG: O-acetyl-ADP-ribose deacetylase [Acidobacteriota bacterium]|nr:O-acetyl-ADP-ribose deacetylase [Acidobacteriota bacterium]